MYIIKQMSTEIGKEISTWKYEGEYAIYNLESYDVLKERSSGITVEKRWKNYYCFFDEYSDELFAYLNIMQKPSGEVFIGIGVKPKYCGKGMGKEFLKYGVNKAKECYPNSKITLEVRSWNIRAIKCYQSVGFKITESVMKEDHSGDMTEFVLMEYD